MTLAESLPVVNACLNATAAVMLVGGFVSIKRGRREAHKRFMLGAFAASTIFLASYLTRYALTGTTHFPGQGGWKLAYLAILFSHMFLAMGLVPPRRGDASAPLPFRAWCWVMLASLSFMLFAAANQYGRMQWNTGVRYLMPLVPFFFLAATNHLARMRGVGLAILGGAAVLHSWVVSMRRESVLGVLGDWDRFLREGPRLPWLDVLSRTATGRGAIPQGATIHVAVGDISIRCPGLGLAMRDAGRTPAAPGRVRRVGRRSTR